MPDTPHDGMEQVFAYPKAARRQPLYGAPAIIVSWSLGAYILVNSKGELAALLLISFLWAFGVLTLYVIVSGSFQFSDVVVLRCGLGLRRFGRIWTFVNWSEIHRVERYRLKPAAWEPIRSHYRIVRSTSAAPVAFWSRLVFPLKDIAIGEEIEGFGKLQSIIRTNSEKYGFRMPDA